MNKKGRTIKGSDIRTLLDQNQKMRELLESWPAREIMMSFEKDWNEKRMDFLNSHPPLDLTRAESEK